MCYYDYSNTIVKLWGVAMKPHHLFDRRYHDMQTVLPQQHEFNKILESESFDDF